MLAEYGAKASNSFLEETASCYMVRVYVCVQGVDKLDAEFLRNFDIAVHSLQHRVDYNAFLSIGVRQNVSVCERLVIQQL